MKRKLIQMAGKTMVVSLPSSWVKKYGLKKGEEIDLEEQGQRVVISTGKEYDIEKVRIDLKGATERAIRWTLSALHKSGFDEIVIDHDKKETVKIIEELIKDLYTGFTIMEQTKERCILKSISKDKESELDPTLRRAFLVTMSMGEETLEAIKKRKFGDLKELAMKERMNNQLTNFCERILNKRGYKDHKKTNFMYVIAWNLEKICDNYNYICNLLKDAKKVKIGNDIIKLYESANNLFKEYYGLFYKFDINRLSELGAKKKEIEKETRKIMKGKTEIEVELIHHLLTIVSQTADFSASTIALNQRID